MTKAQNYPQCKIKAPYHPKRARPRQK